jgi:hypothetical protein
MESGQYLLRRPHFGHAGPSCSFGWLLDMIIGLLWGFVDKGELASALDLVGQLPPGLRDHDQLDLMRWSVTA